MTNRNFLFKVIFGVVTLASIQGCALSAEIKKRNVILVSIDTVSAEHMGLYGYLRDNTPQLTKFGRENIVFEGAYSQAAYTLASHYSIFTGQFPQTHGVWSDTRGSLSTDSKNLFEYMKDAGYRTHWVGITQDPELSLERGLGRGIDAFSSSVLGKLDRPTGLASLREILAAINKSSQPSFVFFHTYYAHDPYRYSLDSVPDPYFGQNFKKKKFETEKEVDSLFDSTSFSPDSFQAVRKKYISQFDLEDEMDVLHLVAMYDAGIQTLDHKLGIFFDELRRAGIYDNSLIILTSDHGESFGGEGGFFHEIPRQNLLHVPLIIKIPGYQSMRINSAVFGIDLLPTLLGHLKIPVRDNVEGRNLAPLLAGKPLDLPKYSLALGYHSEAINDFKWKLIEFRNGEKKLYRIFEDPRESNNLLEKYPNEALRLQTILATYKANRSSGNFPLSEN